MGFRDDRHASGGEAGPRRLIGIWVPLQGVE